MKTRKAFWLKEFDAERILSRAYFKRFNLPQKSDDEILKTLEPAADDSIDSLERKVTLVRSLHEQAKKLNNNLIVRYLNWHGERKLPVYIEVTDANFAVSNLINRLAKIYYEVEGTAQQKYRKIFADRLKKYRKAAGLTQRELGELVQVSPQGMSNYVKGRRDVPTHTLIRIAKILRITTDDLLGFR